MTSTLHLDGGFGELELTVELRDKGATIEVSQSIEFMDEPGEGNVELLDADKQAYTQTHDEISTSSIGPVLVTQHAIDQYQARVTWRPKKTLGLPCWPTPAPGATQVQPFDDKVARHKARKYGRFDNVEVWGHRDSNFKYLMLINDDDNKRVLVTVFERNE